MLRLQLLNCFWLLLPTFAWNAIFAAPVATARFQIGRYPGPSAALWKRQSA